MSYNCPQTRNLVVQPITGVVGTTLGNTLLCTPTQKFYPVWVSLELTGVGSLLTACTVSVGTNSTSYNNILSATLLTGLSSLNGVLNILLNSQIVAVAAGTAINARVSIAATATTYNFNVCVIGYYV